jgi:uncharacterized repeat protein (TIGR01451 family)
MRLILAILLRSRVLLMVALMGSFASAGWAQTCGTGETLVTFNFATTPSTNATGGTGTWTTSSLGPRSWPVGLATSGTANTLTFQMDSSGATWQAIPGGPVGNSPAQYQIGNMAGALVLAMDATAPGGQTGMTITFARPMNKVRFTMADVDMDPFGGGSDFQDRLQIAGYRSGVAVQPTTTPVGTASYYATATVGDFAEITRTNTNATCPHGDQTTTGCNITVNFSAPIDKMRLNFQAGPTIAAPTLQYVGFDNFSFCEPSTPDLKLTKTTTATPFVAGQTGTYTLTISNVGGTPTTGNYTVTDVIATTGVTFPSPQAPGGGWTCTVGTTAFASDTASCVRSTALPVNGTTSLTLTVVVSATTTATVTNRAKAFGGNDPNKTLLTSTGAVASCSAANEGLNGGGGASNAGCAYEDTTLVRQAYLTITKSNGVTTVTSGATTSYTVTIGNLGPSAAPNAQFLDPAATGLNCTTVTFTSTPLGSVTVSPSPLTLTALQSTGIFLTPTFPPGSTATFNVTCAITASGS